MLRNGIHSFLLLPILIGSVLLEGCSGGDHIEAPAAGPPNVIFLLTDDHRWDALGAAGNDIIQTPNLDQIAADGVRFRNAYVTTPICAISRASFFSGQYERRHGIHNFRTDFTEDAFAQTYPALLRDAGYWTGFVGKWGVGETMPEDEFDYWKGHPGQLEYETVDEDGRPIHLTRLLGRQSVDFLETAPENQPFHLSVSFKAPHVQDKDERQFIYDPAYKDLYQDDDIPMPVTADEQYWERLPDFFRENNEARHRWEIRFSTPKKYQESVKGYYRLITGVDVVVGRILEALEETGHADNTIIIFTGDNGFYLGEHGLAGKWYGHEESIRVPLLIYDPRLPRQQRGRVIDEMALNVDIAPTILSYAGVPVPSQMQGEDLRPLVNGADMDWREDFLFEHLFQHGRIPKSDGVVADRYKYLRFVDEEPVYEMLFDLEKDPHETDNVAANPEYASVLRHMRERYEDLVAEAGPARD